MPPSHELDNHDWMEEHEMLPTPPRAARYVVSRTVAPLTLESVCAELQHHALALGFATVRLEQSYSVALGSSYTAAVVDCGELHMLTYSYEVFALAGLRSVAIDRLNALAARPYAGATL